MDVTPSPKMYESMVKFTDAVAGPAPLDVEKGAGAEHRREVRRFMMDYMHRLVHLSMREGAARAMKTHTPSGLELPRG